MTSTVQKLRGQIDTLKGDKAALVKTIDQMTSINKESLDNVNELKGQIKQLESDKRVYKEYMDTFKGDLEDSRARAERLKQKLERAETFEKTAQDQRRMKQQLMQESDDQQRILHQKDLEVKHLKDLVADLKTGMHPDVSRRLDKILDDSNKQIQTQMRMALKLQKMLSEERVATDKMRAEMPLLKQQAQELEGKLNKANKECNDKIDLMFKQHVKAVQAISNLDSKRLVEAVRQRGHAAIKKAAQTQERHDAEMDRVTNEHRLLKQQQRELQDEHEMLSANLRSLEQTAGEYKSMLDEAGIYRDEDGVVWTDAAEDGYEDAESIQVREAREIQSLDPGYNTSGFGI